MNNVLWLLIMLLSKGGCPQIFLDRALACIMLLESSDFPAASTRKRAQPFPRMLTMKEPHDSLLYGCLFGARKHRSLYRLQQQLLFISSFQDPISRNMQCSPETLWFWECRKNDEHVLFNLFLSYIDH